MGATGLERVVAFNRLLINGVRTATAGRTELPRSLVYPHMCLQDVAIGLVSAMIFLALRLTLGNVIMPYLLRNHKKDKQEKLTENIYYTAYYCGATFLFTLVAREETWVWVAMTLSNDPTDESSFLALFPPLPLPYSSIVHFYYMISLGFYLSAVVFLFRYDTRRSDFNELVFHHGITLGLVILSYYYGYLRSGVVILVLHDVGDIFLYLAKTLHYLGLAGMDTAVFAIFAVTFYVSRLVLLPRMTYTITVESFRKLAYDPTYNDWARNFEINLLHLTIFGALLYSLILLHCFWFTLILKMIYRELFLGEKISDNGDIREE